MTAISESVRLEIVAGDVGDIALVIVDNPPVNALSWHVRQGLFDGINQAVDGGAKAIVVICDGRTFIAGADISEFSGAAKGPGLQQIQDAMENAPVPVVAAIHGTALGGGLEVALCAHHRVALSSAKFGLPEVNLGLLPGAGGTQRLPRLVGVPKALEMMTSGRHIGTSEALEAGLIDDVTTGGPTELRDAAVAFANKAVAENLPLARVRDRDERVLDARGNDQLFADFRASIARKTRGFLAPEYNIQCIEAAANLPFDDGLKVEGKLFMELMTGPQSGAQRYAFFAERAANKIPDIAKDTPTIDVQKCGVLGAGTMGGGIAMNFANAGIAVTIVERDQAALDRGLGVVRKNYERSASRGSIPADAVEQRMALITGSTDKADFADCDMVIEAVFEDPKVKEQVFAEIEPFLADGALLGSNTSTLPITGLSGYVSRPEDFIGLHFFSPVDKMPLLEIIKGERGSEDTLNRALDVAKVIGKTPIVVNDSRGFFTSRVIGTFINEGIAMLAEGIPAPTIEQASSQAGYPAPVLQLSDELNMELMTKIRKASKEAVEADGGTWTDHPAFAVIDTMIAAGRPSRLKGAGFYEYVEGKRTGLWPGLEETFPVSGDPSQLSLVDLEERMLFIESLETVKCLDEGVIESVADANIGSIFGIGFPGWTGGVVQYMNGYEGGLAGFVARARELAATYGDRFEPPASLVAKAEAGETYSDAALATAQR